MATTGLANNFRIRNAQDFIEFVESAGSTIYVFLGRTSPWPDEQNPPIAQNDFSEILGAWEDMNGLREITTLDISLGFREVLWQSGRTYVQYDDEVDLTGQDFYVLTDQLNVYKCISNGNGSVSTVQPTQTTSDIPLQSDGYKWRYMFSVTSSSLRKFIVPGFFSFNPDPSGLTATQPGTIDNIRIDAGGEQFPPNASVTTNSELPVFIEGDGDQNSSGTVSVSTIQGQIIAINNITSGGSNYPYAPESDIPVALRQVTTNGVVQTAYGLASTNPSGEIDSVNLVIGGSGYIDGECNIVLSSCRAYAETNNNGEIINAEIATGRSGQNFKQASAVVIHPIGTGDVLKPIISPFEGHGSDPAKELLANFVLINLRLSGTQDFLGLNDFRRVGLVENPAQYDTQQTDGTYLPFTGGLGDLKYRLTLDSGDNTIFTQGEQIIGQTSGATGIEMNLFDDNKLRVRLDNSIDSDLEFIVGETIVGVESGTNDVITAIEEPDIEPYEGEILYINNREVIQSENPQQIETITLVLEY